MPALERIEKKELKNVVALLILDSKHLMERIVERKLEYISEFSLKRTREHFKEIFFSRYREVKASDLKKLSSEMIVCLDEFYSLVEEFYWYLMHTQDMTQGVETQSTLFIKKLRVSFAQLENYLAAELEILEESTRS